MSSPYLRFIYLPKYTLLNARSKSNRLLPQEKPSQWLGFSAIFAFSELLRSNIRMTPSNFASGPF